MNKPAATSSERAMHVCIEACSRCHEICLQTAMNHCIEIVGKRVKPKHFRRLMNFAEICQTSANFQLGSSAFHDRVCEVCAESLMQMARA